MRIAGEPARPPRATSRSERRPRRTGAEHSARQPVDDDGSERPGSISAPAQIAVDERRTRRRYGGACARLTDRPTNQACRGGGIGTPPRLRKRRDGDPRAPTFRTAVVSVVPAADSPVSGAPWHAAHRTLPGSRQPIGWPRSPLVRAALGRARIADSAPRLPARSSTGCRHAPRADRSASQRSASSAPHGSAQPIANRDRRPKPAAILHVGRPHAPCRSSASQIVHPASIRWPWAGAARTNALTPPSVDGTSNYKPG